MTKKTVKNQKVYTCFVPETFLIWDWHKDDYVKQETGLTITRMALHPMKVNKSDFDDLIHTEYKEKLFLFRVVFRVKDKWHYSCLGKDGETNEHHAGDKVGNNGTIEEALRWLLEDEENMEELKSIFVWSKFNPNRY